MHNLKINCRHYGIIQRVFPQQGESTCKVCGEKCANLTEHDCSGIQKCIHCGNQHNSNDTKCPMLKDYRAALTRNMLSKASAAPPHTGYAMGQPSFVDFPNLNPTQRTSAYSNTTARFMYKNFDELSKKLDSVLLKLEDEWKKTHEALEQIKEEMKTGNEELKQTVLQVEKRVDSFEQKLRSFVGANNIMLERICVCIGESFKDKSWKQGIKTYVRQVNVLTEPSPGSSSPTNSNG